MEIRIPDFTKLTWNLNVALIGAIFSVFALIYNEQFIYYGFTTTVYGIAGHILSLAYDNKLITNNKKGLALLFSSQCIMLIMWFVVLVMIYN